ncbi:MAG: putative glycoside hydrolase [Candidatus Komeilibacteria bacterium]
MKAFKFYIVIFIILSICLPQISFGIKEDYPKLANYYLKWRINDMDVNELAKWDVLVLDMQNQYTSNEALKKIKEINPDITLLAYMTVEEVRDQHSGTDAGNPWRTLYDKVNGSNLWLYSNSSQKLSVWQGTSMIDITNNAWQSWLPNFLKNDILVNEYWDGIFLDNCFDSISWIGGSRVSDNSWKIAMNSLLQKINNTISSEHLLVVNSSSSYASYTNGRLYEGWPEVYTGTWQTNMNDYLNLVDKVKEPTTIIINSNTGNSNNRTDYRTMRFGLTSALLSDAYFSFDYGDQDHAQTWWYDEYDQYLGKPLNEAYNLLQDNSYGLWRRDFEQGSILINPSLTDHRIKLGAEFEKITGVQDPSTNNGQIVTAVDIKSQDGLIILRRSKNITGAVFRNGSFAKIYDQYGSKVKNGYFVYDNKAAGDNKVASVDLDSDGKLDKVIAGNNWIDIYNEDEFVKRFYPYTEGYNQGINFAVGDLNGDGWVEIITGTERGGGPQIRIFSSDGRLINPGFFAYSDKFRGGVSVAVADMNNNGQMEIVAGAGYGGGPHVRIFDASGQLLSPGFMAFDPSFRGGVTVATADLNNDGRAEIVTTPGRGGKAEVRTFSMEGELLNEWAVNEGSNTLGLDLSILDISGDGVLDIVAMTRNIFSW